MFGFLGPNGAGKTTTLHMLIGLARPDAGSIRIGGLDCRKNPKAAQLLQDFDLSQAAHRRFGGYSKGMKRKRAIAADAMKLEKMKAAA